MEEDETISLAFNFLIIMPDLDTQNGHNEGLRFPNQILHILKTCQHATTESEKNLSPITKINHPAHSPENGAEMLPSSSYDSAD